MPKKLDLNIIRQEAVFLFRMKLLTKNWLSILADTHYDKKQKEQRFLKKIKVW
jgi:hypothetical protein